MWALLFVYLRGGFPRVQDYWCGYKFFCYAYYSHSVQHESEFADCKLGSCHSSISRIYFARLVSCWFHLLLGFSACMLCLYLMGFPGCLCCAGRLLWRRLPRLPAPSHHVIRTACIQLLPAVETFCKVELHEDCGNLRALMLRFEDEQELQSSELGRSLLLMIGDEDDGLNNLSRRIHIDAPQNPFAAIRARIAAVDIAFRGLRPQVQVVSRFYAACSLREIFLMPMQLLPHMAWFANKNAEFACRASHCLPLPSLFHFGESPELLAAAFLCWVCVHTLRHMWLVDFFFLSVWLVFILLNYLRHCTGSNFCTLNL